tara:strand:- start:156 stop:347 length:192 start_codon:yes stop_codon:yes gene_type:complete
MNTEEKIEELKENINSLQKTLEDFIDQHNSKNNKINKLENEIEFLKKTISSNLDELEKLVTEK